MRIGIDLDDTICNTTQIVQDRVKRYAKEEDLNELDIMNDEDLRQSFFNIYLEDIYTNVEAKTEAIKVLHRLKSKGNKIFVITARSEKTTAAIKDLMKIIDDWLKKYNIEVDGVITSAYGDTKASACKELKIDIMIDDDPYNYKKIISTGTKCIIFDDMDKFEPNSHILTTWKDIEDYIERNR